MTLVHDSGVILDTSHSLGLWVKTSDNTKQERRVTWALTLNTITYAAITSNKSPF